MVVPEEAVTVPTNPSGRAKNASDGVRSALPRSLEPLAVGLPLLAGWDRRAGNAGRCQRLQDDSSVDHWSARSLSP